MRNSGNGRITFHLKIYSHLVWQVAQAIHCSSFMGIWASMDNLIRSYGNFSLYHFPEKRTGQKSRDDCFLFATNIKLSLDCHFLWDAIPFCCINRDFYPLDFYSCYHHPVLEPLSCSCTVTCSLSVMDKLCICFELPVLENQSLTFSLKSVIEHVLDVEETCPEVMKT